MSWGTVTLGALALKETYTISDNLNETTGVRKVAISGRETNGWMTRDRLREIAEDMLSLRSRYLPVTFSNKTDRDGYYRIEDVNVSVLDWDANGVALDWSMDLSYLGPDNAVDVESRLTHVVRANSGGLSGERWHAPPAGHFGYYVGSSLPATVSRTGEDGTVKVYRSIPAVSPRYGCPVDGFMVGRARVLAGGVERFGTGIRMASTGWEVSNGLVRVRPSTMAGTTLLVGVWADGVWRDRDWDLRLSNDVLLPGTHFTGVTVIQNLPQLVTLRLIAGQPSNGARVVLDLSVRRGARTIEGHLQRISAGDITATLDVAETWTLTGGYASANAADAFGFRWAAGSSKAVTLASPNGGISLAAATSLDFWIGAQVPSADPGNSVATLHAQYIAVAGENVVVVPR